MEQLCMKRPKDGMATGLLQVPQSFDCDPVYRFHPKQVLPQI
jgi:hypothetical protein